MVLFPHTSMTTMTTFLGTNLIVKKTNWVEYARKISFGAMPSPNSGEQYTIILAK